LKIAFIFGKGIDGCGVTKGAHIYEDWLRKNGHDTIVVAFNNGKNLLGLNTPFGKARFIP